MQDYITPDEFARFIRQASRGSRQLDGAVLAKADGVELTATDARTGTLRDRAFHSHVPSLKRFIRRNRNAEFTLAIHALGTVARQLRSALGAPDFYKRVEGREVMDIRECPVEVGGREAIFLADGQVNAWTAVTIRWPRDPEGRATLRDTLVILIEPHGCATQGSGNREKSTTRQGTLTFG